MHTGFILDGPEEQVDAGSVAVHVEGVGVELQRFLRVDVRPVLQLRLPPVVQLRHKVKHLAHELRRQVCG